MLLVVVLCEKHLRGVREGRSLLLRGYGGIGLFRLFFRPCLVVRRLRVRLQFCCPVLPRLVIRLLVSVAW